MVVLDKYETMLVDAIEVAIEIDVRISVICITDHFAEFLGSTVF